ncbi:MAG: ParA family protein [Hydrogenoanaerobacterium sp.]
MSKPIVISVANEKGGVGKTTTTLNIGAGLNKAGKKVLLIDLDQQGNLSDYLGFDFSTGPTISELIYSEVARQPLNHSAYILTGAEGLDYIPSSKMLATTTSILSNDRDSDTVLRRILSSSYFDKYDFILIDCRPSLDLLVVNALVASDKIIIPVQAEKFAVDGVSALLDTYERIRHNQNPALSIGGILITMCDARTNMAKDVELLLRESFGSKVYSTVIPRLAEAATSTSAQKSLVETKNSRLGKKYMEVVEEITNE